MSGQRKGRSRPSSPRKPARASSPLPSANDQAARFTRVRQDHSAELAEDYVELVAQLIRTRGAARTVDVARCLGVSHVTVTKTIARLRREGLVQSGPYQAIALTGAGRRLARTAAARHALLVRFLRALGVNAADAETDAEGMEHHVGPATIRAIRRFMKRNR